MGTGIFCAAVKKLRYVPSVWLYPGAGRGCLTLFSPDDADAIYRPVFLRGELT
jgi:hypothetical protein